MDIRGYLQTSLIEWPGKISAVVWVSGCNFRCPFCDNRDLILHPEKLSQFPEKKILADLEKRKRLIDAVVVTGGEPTLQPDLPDFLKKIKKLGFLTMIETNGTRPEALKKIFEKKLLDRISLDVKGAFKEYEKVTGVKRKNLKAKVKKSIELIIHSGIPFEFRTTVVPTLHTKKSLIKLARQLKAIIHNSKFIIHNSIWFLQRFQPKTCLDPAFEKIKPLSQKEMKDLLQAVQKYLPQTNLRGI